MQTGLRRALLGLLAVLWFAPCARSTGEITWNPVEIVDEGITDVSSASGVSAVYVDGLWHVVYCHEGRVSYRARDEFGWLPVETVSTVAGAARDPHLAWDGSELWAVWEDDRTGIPEVWARARGTGGWSGELCLTADDTPSRAPVIDAYASFYTVVAWQEGDEPSSIRGRLHVGGWYPPVTISHSSGSAFEPTISTCETCATLFAVAWADTRSGRAQIYLSGGDGVDWDTEIPLIDLPGECRRPSMRSEWCCGDALTPFVVIGFDHAQPGGVPEAWAGCGNPAGMAQLSRVSPDDGVPSTAPAAASFSFSSGWDMGGSFPRTMLVWTDGGTPNAPRMSSIDECPSDEGPLHTLSVAGLGHATLAAAEGNPAQLLALWCEEIDGVSTLIAQRGVTQGCSAPELHGPAALLLAPGGEPADTLLLLDECTQLPVEGGEVRIEFDAELDEALTWDTLQPHPVIYATSDAAGQAIFSLRGGGCSSAGTAVARVGIGLDDPPIWQGAKSPDLNGDCYVGPDDLEAVEGALGSDDFCADLDGSGLVDAADLAIVEAALGDRCPSSAGVDGSEDETVAPGVRLRVEPNPCLQRAALALYGVRSPLRIRVIDVNGRPVRSMDAGPTGSGTARIDWDTRDDHGHLVPAGFYAILVSGAGTALSRSLLVLR